MKTFRPDNSQAPSDYINSLSVDNSNNIWIGSIAGLAKFDGVNWTIFDTSNSALPSNIVNAINILINKVDYG